MKKKVIARLFIKDQSIEGFKQLAAAVIPKTRGETGCLCYSLFQDISSPGEFLFYEEYADEAALDHHFKSGHLQAFRVSVEGMHAKEKIVDVI